MEIEALLPPNGRILDLGAGTGRLSHALVARGRQVVMLDSSAAMLDCAVQETAAPAIQGDAFSLPFARGSFTSVVALRVAFHFADARALLQAVAPVVATGGRLVFDTYRWSPRSMLPLAAGRWGGKVYPHAASTIVAAAHAAGFVVADQRDCFLFSPYLYRLLPLAIVRGLALIEALCPSTARARTFWALERVG